MADSKITALTALTAADPVNDMFPVVDVSDTTMAASGTTKKISVNNILSSSPTASGALTVTGLVTAGSAAITGALTSGTTTLVSHAAGYTGKVGIGTATPATNLHIVNDTAATNSAVDVLTITQSSTGTAASGLGGGVLFKSERPSGGLILNRGAIYGVAGTDPDDDGDLAFYTLTDTGASGFTEKVRINALGNIVMKTVNTGIDFSINSNAGGATSELLNDYEEGTFTPTVIGTSTVGTVTYARQLGRYTKVGNLVTVQIFLSWSAGTGTGNLAFGGLPFTIANNANEYPSVAIGQFDSIALTASNVPSIIGSPNTTVFNVNQFPVGGGSNTGVAYDGAGGIIMTSTYIV